MIFTIILMGKIMEEQLVLFGKRLQYLRKEKELSQEQLGLSCGLDRTYISGVERGTRNISLLNILKIAGALNLDAAELMKFGGAKHG